MWQIREHYIVRDKARLKYGQGVGKSEIGIFKNSKQKNVITQLRTHWIDSRSN